MIAPLLCGALLSVTAPPMLTEIRVDSLNPMLNIEYIELTGVAGDSLDGLSIVVIGDLEDLPGAPIPNSGIIEAVISLDGLSIPDDRYMLISSSGLLLPTPDFVAFLNLEDADNLTVLLVRACKCTLSDDLDFNDDGVLDSTPWSEIVDGLSFVSTSEGDLSEWTYASARVGDGLGPLTFKATRCRDTGDWRAGSASFHLGTLDTPGLPNAPYAGSLCVGDIVVNGSVGAQDLALLLDSWGQLNTVADLSDDGLVGAQDLSILLAHWGDCEL